MKELTNFSKKELIEIGNSILAELNISLFNAEPTIHKAYQICSELIHEGYATDNKELTCHLIYKYIKKRTRRNQNQEFYNSFEIHLNDRLRSVFTLSFRTSVIEEEKIKNIASRIYPLLSPFGIRNYGINQDVLCSSIRDLYKLKYYENEWKVGHNQFSSKITKYLNPENTEGRHQVENLFKAFELGADIPLEVKKESILSSTLKTINTLHDGFNENTNFIDNIIKDSEIEFIKETLNCLNQNEIFEILKTKIYKNETRHPLITNFINLTKQYNFIMSKRNSNFKEILLELKITVKAIRETGTEIIKLHSEMIQERVDRMEMDLKMVG